MEREKLSDHISSHMDQVAGQKDIFWIPLSDKFKVQMRCEAALQASSAADAKKRREKEEKELFNMTSVDLRKQQFPYLRCVCLHVELFLSLSLFLFCFFVRGKLKSGVGLPNTQNAQTRLSGLDAKLPWSELRKVWKHAKFARCHQQHQQHHHPPPPPPPQSGGAQVVSNFFLHSISSKWCALRLRNLRAPSAN